jgi:hypothetical protein
VPHSVSSHSGQVPPLAATAQSGYRCVWLHVANLQPPQTLSGVSGSSGLVAISTLGVCIIIGGGGGGRAKGCPAQPVGVCVSAHVLQGTARLHLHPAPVH